MSINPKETLSSFFGSMRHFSKEKIQFFSLKMFGFVSRWVKSSFRILLSVKGIHWVSRNCFLSFIYMCVCPGHNLKTLRFFSFRYSADFGRFRLAFSKFWQISTISEPPNSEPPNSEAPTPNPPTPNPPTPNPPTPNPPTPNPPTPNPPTPNPPTPNPPTPKPPLNSEHLLQPTPPPSNPKEL